MTRRTKQTWNAGMCLALSVLNGTSIKYWVARIYPDQWLADFGLFLGLLVFVGCLIMAAASWDGRDDE